MPSSLLRILLLEDVKSDADLIRKSLRSQDLKFTMEWVSTGARYKEQLLLFRPDVILSDYFLPGFSGPEALVEARKQIPDVAFIFVTGSINEQVAVDALKSGADDYVLKEYLSLLGPAIHRALEKSRQRKEQAATLEALRKSEERYRSTVESLHDIIYYVDADGYFRDIFTPKSVKLKNPVSPDQFLDKHYASILPPHVVSQIDDTIRKIKNGAGTIEFKYPLKIDKRQFWFRATITGRFDHGKYQGFTGVVKDITGQRKAEELLRLSMESVEHMGDAVYWIAPDGRIRYVNKEACRELGYTREELLKLTVFDLSPHFPKKQWPNHWKQLQSQTSINFESIHRRKDGSEFPVEISANLVRLEGKEYNCTFARNITVRNQAQEELREIKERFQTLVDTAKDAIIGLNHKRKISVWNQAAIDLFGYTKQEALGKDLHKLIVPPRYHEKVYRGLDHFFKTGKGPIIGQIIELTGLKKDGTEFPIELSISAVQRSGYWEATGIIRNMTERKQADAQIRMLSTAVHQSPSMVVLTDTDWIIQYVNPRFEEVTGYSKKEALGKNLRHLLEGESASDIDFRDIQAVVVQGKTWQGRFHNRRKDGTLYWESAVISPVTDPEGRVTQILSLKQDITDQVEAREQLERNEQRFRSVVENSNDGLYVLSGNHFLYVNSRFTEITGFSEKEVTDESFDYTVMMTEKGKATVEERVAARKRGKSVPDQYIFQGITKSGKIRYFEVSISPIEWDGTPATLGNLRDVTDTILLQEELKNALELAKQGEEIKRLFLANMSHEIRTPLNAIIGFTDLLHNTLQDRLTEEEQSFFNQVIDSGNRLIHTVHEIMDMSQLEAGSFKVYPETVDLVEILKGVFLSREAGARNKALAYSLDCQEEKVFIYADPMCIQRALENLIDNAIKYTEKGSVIVCLKRRKQKVLIEIRDTGIGISEDYLSKLFKPFSQESEGYTKKYQGVGLGLALTKQYLDLNSVEIEVSSKKGKGTRIFLYFDEKEENPSLS